MVNEGTPLLPDADADNGLKKIGGFCGGVINDYRRRFTAERLKSDWVGDAATSKTVSAALFMFFATFTSTLALGEAINTSTKGLIGLNEYLMMNSAAGMLHAVLGCQPLLVLRPTGPVTLLFSKLVGIATDYALPFWPFFAWTGIFVGVLMILIAAFELSRYFDYVTSFVDSIFATFIGFIYINDGLQGMKHLWYDAAEHHGSLEAAKDVISVNMTILMAVVALWLSSVQSSKLFSYEVRTIMVEYALTVAFAIAIVAAWWLDRNFCPVIFIDTSKSGFQPTDDRAWLTDLFSLPPHGIAIAAVASLPIVIFFYLDQNISSALCQSPDMKLSKGSYYHSSFGFMGMLNVFAPLVGLPFVTGSLPHSPQFVMALTEYDDQKKPVKVYENRVAPFLFYLGLGLPLAFPSLLSPIPKAAVSSTLIFVGVQGVMSTQLFDRVLMIITEKKHWPTDRPYSHLKQEKIFLYTAIQASLVAASWMCNALLGLAFPLFVASLVPFRWLVLPKYFEDKDLVALDDMELEEELDHESQKEPEPNPNRRPSIRRPSKQTVMD